MSVFTAIFRSRKKVFGSKPVMSWSKCPFCRAINKSLKNKCRDCGLKYPFKLEKNNSEVLSKFNVTLIDPRSILEIKIEKYIGLAIFIVIVLPYAIEYIFKGSGYFNHGQLDILQKFLTGFLPSVFAVLTVTKSRNYAEQVCKSCKQVMVIRVSRSCSTFPASVECWNCGAIHDINWEDKLPEKDYTS